MTHSVAFFDNAYDDIDLQCWTVLTCVSLAFALAPWRAILQFLVLCRSQMLCQHFTCLAIYLYTGLPMEPC